MMFPDFISGLITTLGKGLNMRIVLVYDQLGEAGGAKKLIATLARGLEDRGYTVDIYTSYYRSGKTWGWFDDLSVKPLFDDQPTLLEIIEGFADLDLSKYDCLITSGQGAKMVALKNRVTLHYEHSPLPRHLEHVISEEGIDIFKERDSVATSKLPSIITNSNFTKKGIKEYYGASCPPVKVVYPPVDPVRFEPTNGSYYLSVQRIAPYKRVNDQVEAFRKLDDNLFVIGSLAIGFEDYCLDLISKAPDNVKFLGGVSEEKKHQMLAGCLAFVTTSEESFGIAPVEAMMYSKPVYAADRGGFRETVVHGKTGLLLQEPYDAKLVDGIREYPPYLFDQETCRKRGMLFNKDRFVERMYFFLEQTFSGIN